MKVNINKIKQVNIHEFTLRSLEDFIDIHIRDTENPPIWCSGYIMMPYLFSPDLEYIIKDRVENGVVHYQELVVAPMPKYRKRIKRNDMGFEQEVLNMENDEYFCKLVDGFQK